MTQRQPNSGICFVCGIENPIGLKLSFHTDDEDRCIAHFQARPGFQGYPGQLHGGIISTLLDIPNPIAVLVRILRVGFCMTAAWHGRTSGLRFIAVEQALDLTASKDHAIVSARARKTCNVVRRRGMAELRETELDRLRETILTILRPYQVKRVALFGSVVRGEDAPGSDLDILVTLPPPGERPVIGLRWLDLAEELSLLLDRPVDLVTEDGLSPYIRPYIEKEMVVLHEQA